MFEISLVHQLKNRGASPAIEVDQYAKTYAELAEDVRRAALLLRRKAQPEARIGILAQRSYLSIVAILATVEAGMTYVPLNPKFPAKLETFFNRSTGNLGLRGT